MLSIFIIHYLMIHCVSCMQQYPKATLQAWWVVAASVRLERNGSVSILPCGDTDFYVQQALHVWWLPVEQLYMYTHEVHHKWGHQVHLTHDEESYKQGPHLTMSLLDSNNIEGASGEVPQLQVFWIWQYCFFWGWQQSSILSCQNGNIDSSTSFLCGSGWAQTSLQSRKRVPYS